jgi:ankyrin repeat protein
MASHAQQQRRRMSAKLLSEEPAEVKEARKRLAKFFESCARGDVENAASLVKEGGVPIDSTDAAGCTALMKASRLGHLDLATWLVSNNAHIETHHLNARAPLAWAADAGQLAIVSLLLNSGALVEATDSGGYTALHLAVRAGRVDVVKALIEANANVSALTKAGYSPLMFAAVKNEEIIARCLIKNGADIEWMNESGYTA